MNEIGGKYDHILKCIFYLQLAPNMIIRNICLMVKQDSQIRIARLTNYYKCKAN